jgi:hypothetical protein
MFISSNIQDILTLHIGRKRRSVIKNFNVIRHLHGTEATVCKLMDIIQEIWLIENVGSSGEMPKGHGVEF